MPRLASSISIRKANSAHREQKRESEGDEQRNPGLISKRADEHDEDFGRDRHVSRGRDS
jgi:hypothetical protein